MIGFTHLSFAFALTYLAGYPVVYGMFGGILPDVDILMDFGFPFTHRGILHTPVAVVVFATVLYLATGRKSPVLAFGTGYLSHLFLDTFTFSGVMWLYPLQTELSFSFIEYSSLAANSGLTLLSLSLPVIWMHRRRLRRWMR